MFSSMSNSLSARNFILCKFGLKTCAYLMLPLAGWQTTETLGDLARENCTCKRAACPTQMDFCDSSDSKIAIPKSVRPGRCSKIGNVRMCENCRVGLGGNQHAESGQKRARRFDCSKEGNRPRTRELAGDDPVRQTTGKGAHDHMS